MKINSALEGLTPAFKAGIGVALEGNKWMAHQNPWVGD